MQKELRVLMVEDTAPDALLISHALRKAGLRFRPRRVESRDAFLHELEHHPPDVILSDHGVPGFDGFAALAEARNRCPDVPFIFVTGVPGDRAADETLRSGADGYVLKDTLHLLAPAIERCIRDAGTRVRHRELEAALKETEEHLHLLMAEVREHAVFLLDAAGHISSWNPAAQRMLGYEPTEILGQDCQAILSSESQRHEPPRHLFDNASKTGRVEEVCWCRRKGDQPLRVTLVIVPLRGHFRRTRGFICVLHELHGHDSEPKALLGTETPERAQLEAAHREMEQFTYAIATDLRTPLRHIESLAELLNKSGAERLDAKTRRYVNAISEATHHMSRLVDDLFSFSRIGQAELHQLHISLPDVVKEVIHDLRHEAEGRKVDWVIGDLPEVTGDPVMLWMVLTNLLSNALKFTRPRAAARIEIAGTSPSTEHIISVRDNGVGFEGAHADRLFKVFQKLHAKEFEGTGVGLANVRRIIQRHGGRTWAEGVEGEGAVFYFSLPKG